MLVCNAGFELKGTCPDGIKLSDGRVVVSGGKCDKLRRGTGGGMVFFYCVLSVVLFCSAVIGGKYGMERYTQYRAGQVSWGKKEVPTVRALLLSPAAIFLQHILRMTPWTYPVCARWLTIF